MRFSLTDLSCRQNNLRVVFQRSPQPFGLDINRWNFARSDRILGANKSGETSLRGFALCRDPRPRVFHFQDGSADLQTFARPCCTRRNRTARKGDKAFDLV